VADRLIRITTALAVMTVAVIAAIISYRHEATPVQAQHAAEGANEPEVDRDAPPAPLDVPSLEQAVRDRYNAGASQRAISRDLKIDRRRVKRIVEEPDGRKPPDTVGVAVAAVR
jgi:hypothetical protein